MGSRATLLRSVIVVVALIVLDDDVAAMMHGSIIGAPDDDGIGAVLPMPMALAIVVKSLGSVPAMMEALAVLVDDHNVVVIAMMPMVMSVLAGGNDHVGRGRRSHRRRGQAKRHRAQNQGGFHVQFSEEFKCPSLDKHRWLAFVPPLQSQGRSSANSVLRENERHLWIILNTELIGSYPITEHRKAETNAGIVVQSLICLIKRKLRTLHAQPGLLRFKVIDFDHRSKCFWFEVPSINQPSSTALVPAAECGRWLVTVMQRAQCKFASPAYCADAN
jgi:hypothetical protein